LSVASAPDREREGIGPPEQTAGHRRPSLSRKAAPLTISLTYDGDSNRKTLTRTAGLGTVAEPPYGYDTDSRFSMLNDTTGSAATVEGFFFGYDPSGWLTS
jgi:hypothetical protein